MSQPGAVAEDESNAALVSGGLGSGRRRTALGNRRLGLKLSIEAR